MTGSRGAGPRVSWFGVAGAAGALATDVLYIALIASEDTPNEWGRVAVWALAIAAAALAILSGSIARSRSSRALLIVGTVTLAILGLLAIFSIGILLLASALLAGIAAARTRPTTV